MGSELSPWLVILGMSVVTVLTRLSGYIVLGRYRLSARTQSIMESVPASVLTAIIAPMVLATGPAETLAALGTLLIAWRFPTLVAIISGVVIVVLLRILI